MDDNQRAFKTKVAIEKKDAFLYRLNSLYKLYQTRNCHVDQSIILVIPTMTCTLVVVARTVSVYLSLQRNTASR